MVASDPSHVHLAGEAVADLGLDQVDQGVERADHVILLSPSSLAREHLAGPDYSGPIQSDRERSRNACRRE
ncbi:hypothetical protein GCM10007979_20990 [Nocardioides albus]|nr:hypothetical protein GCM10007979_20990 [Nocardioides albus]